jgi:ABC-type branched-subunit amino acid transport system substrate-binding protein
LAASLLAACGQMNGSVPQPVSSVPPAPPSQQGPRPVALLLPLSGPRADLAQALLKAAQLAAAAPGSPPLDIRDTGGDPARAADAARAAIGAGDALILGPLTAEETQAVSGVSQPANIPVLAFTSDPAAAQPGVWTLGVTPGQQMRRLVSAARDEGRQHFAAVLPDGALGDALASALAQAVGDAGLEAPVIQRGTDIDGATTALKTLTAFDQRQSQLESRIRAMRDSSDPQSRQQAAVLAAQPPPPPPFDALVLGATGDTLLQLADKLPAYDIAAPQVRVLGPALWAQQAGRLGRLSGAWYASLDESARSGYEQAFQAKYGFAAPPISDFAFDAVLIGRTLAQEGDYSANALTRTEGFSGVNGALVLLPDGHVRRALAVFQIEDGGGAHVVSPAPSDLSSPAS